MNSIALKTDRELSVDSFMRMFGILVLILLPFQHFPKTLYMNGYFAGVGSSYIEYISYVDEATCILLYMALASFIIIRPGIYRLTWLPFTSWVLSFIFFAFISMVVNRVSLAQGTFGIYDVVKNIAVVFPYALLRYEEEDFFKTLKLLMVVVFIMALSGIVGELGAVLFVKGINIFVSGEKRFGLYRVIALSGHGNWNYLATFATLMFLIAYVKEKKSRFDGGNMLFTMMLILLSFSRQAWFGFLLAIVLISGKMARWFILLFSLCVLAISSPYSDKMFALFTTNLPLNAEENFRLYAFIKSVTICFSHPVFGLGPGMFGGITSLLFDSPIYNDWPAYFRFWARNSHGIDQFWPIIWGEFGVIGMTLYSMIFIGIFTYLRNVERYFYHQRKIELSNIGRVLRFYMVALVVMGLAGGLNSAFVVYTYFALVGMYISVYLRSKETSPGAS